MLSSQAIEFWYLSKWEYALFLCKSLDGFMVVILLECEHGKAGACIVH